MDCLCWAVLGDNDRCFLSSTATGLGLCFASAGNTMPSPNSDDTGLLLHLIRCHEPSADQCVRFWCDPLAVRDKTLQCPLVKQISHAAVEPIGLLLSSDRGVGTGSPPVRRRRGSFSLGTYGGVGRGRRQRPHFVEPAVNLLGDAAKASAWICRARRLGVTAGFLTLRRGNSCSWVTGCSCELRNFIVVFSK